tara:strand:+ start:754 stop:1344 length:591 start_codon:yes stop_codon:yes gene_type:complete
LKTIKNCFGLKVRIKNKMRHLSFLIIIIISCAPNQSKLTEVEPLILIKNADSLIIQRPKDIELRKAIVKAHLLLAKRNNDPQHYKSVIKLDPKNKSANYYINIQTGKDHHKKGHKNGQWDAIQSFSRAAALIDTLGEPYYWLGQAYEKKDQMDFELTLESYDKALSLYLEPPILTKAKSARLNLLNRKKTYEDFWK